jgi:very-short-patch-repair endonuclease
VTDILVARANQWGGAFSSNDARDAGVDRNGLQRMVANEVAHRVGPRAYVLASAQAKATTPEAKHALLTRAVLRSFAGRIAASHHSALALHGLPFWNVDTEIVHVCRISGRSSRVRDTLHIHESVPTRQLRVLTLTQAIVTSPALAVIGTAMVDGVEAGVVAADAALQRGKVSVQELDDAVTAATGVPRVTHARLAVTMADPRCESPGESRTRLVLHTIPGAPPIRSQHRVRDSFGREVARVDFLVGDRVVVEFDGRVKYGMDGRPEEALWAEKQREDRLRELGLVVVRIVWADLQRPEVIVQRVLAALRLAGSTSRSVDALVR